MKRVVVLAGMAVLLTASAAHAQLLSPVIAGGPHDLSGGSALHNSSAAIGAQTCVFCHTPHGGQNNIPLWNRNAPAAGAYGANLYGSTTTDVTTTSALIAASGSGACMSCHDGTIAVDVLLNVNGAAFAAGAAGTFTRQASAKATYGNSGAGGVSNLMNGGLPFLGTDLRNDHPVTIVYETARGATPSEFVTQVASGSKITVGAAPVLPLFGTATNTATVECASCHNAHNNSLGNFLRIANTGSAMCLKCHIK